MWIAGTKISNSVELILSLHNNAMYATNSNIIMEKISEYDLRFKVGARANFFDQGQMVLPWY